MYKILRIYQQFSTTLCYTPRVVHVRNHYQKMSFLDKRAKLKTGPLSQTSSMTVYSNIIIAILPSLRSTFNCSIGRPGLLSWGEP